MTPRRERGQIIDDDAAPPRRAITRDPDTRERVSVTVSLLVKSGDFQNFRVELGLESDCALADRDMVLEECSSWLDQRIDGVVRDAVNAHSRARRASRETR